MSDNISEKPAKRNRINPYKAFKASIIPDWLMENPDISAGAKLIYSRLLRWAGNKAKCWPTQAEIADKTGLSPSTVKRGLKELEEKHNLIEKDPGRYRGDRTNVYYFLDHPCIEFKTNGSNRAIDNKPMGQIEPPMGQIEPANGSNWPIANNKRIKTELNKQNQGCLVFEKEKEKEKNENCFGSDLGALRDLLAKEYKAAAARYQYEEGLDDDDIKGQCRTIAMRVLDFIENNGLHVTDEPGRDSYYNLIGFMFEVPKSTDVRSFRLAFLRGKNAPFWTSFKKFLEENHPEAFQPPPTPEEIEKRRRFEDARRKRDEDARRKKEKENIEFLAEQA